MCVCVCVAFSLPRRLINGSRSEKFNGAEGDTCVRNKVAGDRAIKINSPHEFGGTFGPGTDGRLKKCAAVAVPNGIRTVSYGTVIKSVGLYRLVEI